MKKLIVFAVLVTGSTAFAEGKIDWKACSADIAKHCAAIKGDHEKHECLEKAGDKVSKSCQTYNHGLEDKFKEHHKDDHGHSH